MDETNETRLKHNVAIKDFTFYTDDKVAKCSPAISAQMAWKEHVIADLR